MFQLPNLGNRDPAGLGFRTKKEKIGMTLEIGVEKVGG
jgi:hypothetical protein